MNEQERKNNSFFSSPMRFLIIGMIILLFLNALIVPMVEGQRIEQTDYGTFIEMVDDGKVEEVQKEGDQIYFNTVDESGKVTMVTGAWDSDTELVNRLYEHNVKFTQIVPQQSTPFQNLLFNWVLPFLLLYLFYYFMTRSMRKRMGGATMSFGQSDAKIYAETDSKVTFDDVAGQEEAKSALMEIVDFLHNPDRYTVIGAKMPKGALLVGPPGTGKTLIARAVAGEAGVPFFSITGSEFVEMFVGVGAAKVRDLFKQANDKAPCIVFIDEIDTIGGRRGDIGSHSEQENTLNQLLSEMDGFDSSKGVVILAATNRPEILDPALTRPGRFDRRIPMELPDLAGREAILQVHAKNVKMGPDVDLNRIALATAGASGADLANMINEAALRAVRENRYAITQSDLEESVEVVIAGYQRKNAVISQEEKRIVSYHEVGHAMVAAKQSGTAPVHKITIIPRTSGALGYTMQVAEEEQHLMTKEEILSQITTMTGGRAAEEVILNTVTSGAANDIEKATKLARAMVTQLGMTEEFGMVAFETVTNQYLGGDTRLNASEETASRVDRKVMEIVEQCHTDAKNIIKENEAKMHEISDFLIAKETITGKEFMDILNAPVKEEYENYKLEDFSKTKEENKEQ